MAEWEIASSQSIAGRSKNKVRHDKTHDKVHFYGAWLKLSPSIISSISVVCSYRAVDFKKSTFAKVHLAKNSPRASGQIYFRTSLFAIKLKGATRRDAIETKWSTPTSWDGPLCTLEGATCQSRSNQLGFTKGPRLSRISCTKHPLNKVVFYLFIFMAKYWNRFFRPPCPALYLEN
jgi:hypothetical protein